MPSLHIAWTLMVLYCLRDRGWPLRIVSTFIAALTLITMLGSGEHWLIDAVVSVPLVAFVFALRARSAGGNLRWTVCGGSGAVTLGWLIALRSGAVLLLPDWGRFVLVVMTIAVGLVVTPALLNHHGPVDRLAGRNKVIADALAGNT